jgi:hypothetical protein
MSRGPQKIRKNDIQTAVNAAAAAGFKVTSYEVDLGNMKIVVNVDGGPACGPNGAAGMSSEAGLDRELAEFEARNGQG